MCYTRKERELERKLERELEREARRVTESRLMEEEARYRQEQHDHPQRAGEHVPLTERVKEMVGSR